MFSSREIQGSQELQEWKEAEYVSCLVKISSYFVRLIKKVWCYIIAALQNAFTSLYHIDVSFVGPTRCGRFSRTSRYSSKLNWESFFGENWSSWMNIMNFGKTKQCFCISVCFCYCFDILQGLPGLEGAPGPHGIPGCNGTKVQNVCCVFDETYSFYWFIVNQLGWAISVFKSFQNHQCDWIFCVFQGERGFDGLPGSPECKDHQYD